MSFAIANFVLVSHYRGKERNSKLALLTFFYCLGAAVSPALGGQLLAQGQEWQISFLWPCGFVWLLALAGSTISRVSGQEMGEPGSRPLPSRVIAIGVALFLFSMAEVSFTSWLTVDGETLMDLPVEKAALLSTVFWAFVGLGRFGASRLLLRVRAQAFILASCVLATTGLLAYWNQPTFELGLGVVALLGLGLAAVNPALIGLGTSQTCSPGALGFLLFSGSLATVAAPLTSQYFHAQSSATNTASSIIYLILVMAIVAVVARPPLSENDDDKHERRSDQHRSPEPD